MSTQTKTKPSYWIHVIITLILMLGIGYLPAPDPITPFGMKIIGIFVGMIYGWSVLDQIWPSLLGLIMLAIVDYDTMANIILDGWGSTTVWSIILILIFSEAVSQAGITNWLAIKLIDHKVFHGRPWLFTSVLIFTAFILSSMTANAFVGMLIMWAIVYEITDLVGYKKRDPWPSVTIVGITFASIVGMGSLPYHLVPLMAFTAYQNMGGPAINYGSYIIVCWGSLILLVIGYLLANKYLLRLNISKVAEIDGDTFKGKDHPLDRRQRILFVIFIVMVVSFLIGHILPTTWPVVSQCAKLGLAGCSALFVAVAMIVKIDDKPLLDFQPIAAKGVLWSAVILTTAALTISDAIVAEETGIQKFLIGVLVPFFSNKPTIVFIALILVFALIMTNFANNAVTALIFMSVTATVAGQVGINVTAMVVLLAIIVHVAVLTPAACPMAGVMFANKEWVDAKFVYKEAIVLMILISIIMCTYGYFMANMLF